MAIEELPRSRPLQGPISWIANLALIGMPLAGIFFLLDLPQRLDWLVFPEQYVGLFLALALCGTFLIVPEGASGHLDRVPWYDLMAAGAGLVVRVLIPLSFPSTPP